MNVIDLVKSGMDISLTISAKDLIDFGRTMIKETKDKLESTILSENNEQYLTRQEVSKMLGVDPSTLWRWEKRDYLRPIKIGGKSRYKLSEIKSLIRGDKNE